VHSRQDRRTCCECERVALKNILTTCKGCGQALWTSNRRNDRDVDIVGIDFRAGNDEHYLDVGKLPNSVL
jgi:hypothetical protein